MFCRDDETWLEAHAALAEMKRDLRCLACELVGKDDETIEEFVRR